MRLLDRLLRPLGWRRRQVLLVARSWPRVRLYRNQRVRQIVIMRGTLDLRGHAITCDQLTMLGPRTGHDPDDQLPTLRLGRGSIVGRGWQL